jgi:hypothetical protein
VQRAEDVNSILLGGLNDGLLYIFVDWAGCDLCFYIFDAVKSIRTSRRCTQTGFLEIMILVTHEGERVPYPCGRLGNCLIEMKAGEEVGRTETPSASAAATP